MKTILLIALVMACAYAGTKSCSCPDGKFWDATKYSCESIAVANCRDAVDNNGVEDGTKCQRCNDTFWLKDATNCVKPTTPINNCAQYKSETECSYCVDKFKVTNDKKICLAYIEGCDNYDETVTKDAHKCKECDFNYKKDGDKCTKKSQIPAECKYLDSAATETDCATCKDKSAHFLKDKKCTPRTNKPAECNGWSSTEDKCTSCKVGKKINAAGDACEDGVAHCTSHNPTDTTKCITCEVHFYGEACTELKSTETTYDANCGNYGADKKCTYCKRQESGAAAYAVDSTGKCTKKCPTISTTGKGGNASIISFVAGPLALLFALLALF